MSESRNIDNSIYEQAELIVDNIRQAFIAVGYSPKTVYELVGCGDDAGE